jgi:hypothetical protein
MLFACALVVITEMVYAKPLGYSDHANQGVGQLVGRFISLGCIVTFSFHLHHIQLST